MNPAIDMKLALDVTLPVIVSSSPIVEILAEQKSCAQAVVSIVSLPNEPLGIRIISLRTKAFIPSIVRGSAEAREGLRKWPVYIGDNSKLFLEPTELMRRI